MGVLSNPANRFAVASMLSLGVMAAHRQGAFDGLMGSFQAETPNPVLAAPAIQSPIPAMIAPERGVVPAQVPVKPAEAPLTASVAVRLQAPTGSWRPFEWDAPFNLPETVPTAPVAVPVDSRATSTPSTTMPAVPAPVKPAPRQPVKVDLPVAAPRSGDDGRAVAMFEAVLFAPWTVGGLFGITAGLGAVFNVTGRRREQDDVDYFTGREPESWSWNLPEMENPSWPGWSGAASEADPSEAQRENPDPASDGLSPRELTTEDMTFAALDDLNSIGAEIGAWQEDLNAWGQGNSDAIQMPEVYQRTLQEFSRRLAAIQEFLPEVLPQYDVYLATEEALSHAAVSFVKGVMEFVEEALDGAKLPNGVGLADLGRYAMMASEILRHQMEVQPLSVDQELREKLRVRIDDILNTTGHRGSESIVRMTGAQIIGANTTIGSARLGAPKEVRPVMMGIGRMDDGIESIIDAKRTMGPLTAPRPGSLRGVMGADEIEINPSLVFDGTTVPVIEVSEPE